MSSKSLKLSWKLADRIQIAWTYVRWFLTLVVGASMGVVSFLDGYSRTVIFLTVLFAVVLFVILCNVAHGWIVKETTKKDDEIAEGRRQRDPAVSPQVSISGGIHVCGFSLERSAFYKHDPVFLVRVRIFNGMTHPIMLQAAKGTAALMSSSITNLQVQHGARVQANRGGQLDMHTSIRDRHADICAKAEAQQEGRLILDLSGVRFVFRAGDNSYEIPLAECAVSFLFTDKEWKSLRD